MHNYSYITDIWRACQVFGGTIGREHSGNADLSPLVALVGGGAAAW